MTDRPRRSERIRRIQMRAQLTRVLFLVDCRTSAPVRGRYPPELQILDGNMPSGRFRYLCVNSPSPDSVVDAVLLPMTQRVLQTPMPSRIRYITHSLTYPPSGTTIRTTLSLYGTVLMAIVVTPAMEILLRDNLTEAIDLILRVAQFFVF